MIEYKKRRKETYIGDAVYTYIDERGFVRLYASDRVNGETNRLVLTRHSIVTLQIWLNQVEDLLEDVVYGEDII